MPALLKPDNYLIQKTSKYRCLWGRSFHTKGDATKPIQSKGIHAYFVVKSNTMPIIFVKVGIRRKEFQNMRISF